MRDKRQGDTRSGEPLEQALARQGLSAEDHLGSALRARWVLDSMVGVVALLAPDGATVELNQAGLELAGVRRQAVIGQPFWAVPTWAPDGSARALLRSAVADAAAGTPSRVEVTLAEGGVMLFELRPLASSTGAVRLVVVEGRDVTELHALAERLRAVDTRRRRFVQAVGHDLKSPLAVLLALTSRAQAAGAADADIDGIAGAARVLGDQVDELLSAARESDAEFEPSLDHQDLAHIVRRRCRASTHWPSSVGCASTSSLPPRWWCTRTAGGSRAPSSTWSTTRCAMRRRRSRCVWRPRGRSPA